MQLQVQQLYNWKNMDYPYQDHCGLNCDKITKEEIDYLLKQPCLFGRKFNPDCKVIKNNSNYSIMRK